MTKPGDPQKGKAAEAEQAEQAAEDSTQEAAVEGAKTEAEASEEQPKPKPRPKPKRSRAKKAPAPAQAEGTAAEETGVDKAGAEAAAVTEPASEAAKPKRARKPAGKRADAPAEAKPAAAPARRRGRGRQTSDRVIVRAQAKYVRSSPRKARLVCDHIRGKTVPEARAILAFSPRSVAEAWSKLLESAVANAENNHDLVGDELRIHAVFADAGPTIKRFRPRAMGRATRIRKRTSHLTIQLTPREG